MIDLKTLPANNPLSNSESTTKILAISVGGTPEPIIKSIEINQPDILVFFTSIGSRTEAETILTKLGSECKPKEENIYFITTLDEQDLVETFQVVENLFKNILIWDPSKKNTIVDYTGGTKVMSSALVTGALLRGFDKLSYVGGKERTKENLGIVVTGTEIPLLSQNPIRLQGYFELQKISELYKKHEYSACREICQAAEKSEWIEDKELFNYLKSAFTYYHYRDLFDFEQSFNALSSKFKNPDSFSRYPQGIQNFLNETYRDRMNMDELKNVNNEIKKYKENWKNKPTYPPNHENLKTLDGSLLLREIYANAERRADQGKFDDAVLRMYRLLEMKAQLQLLIYHGIENGNILLEQIPENLREEYINKNQSKSKNKPQFLKLGMEDSFRLLNDLGDNTANFYNPKQIDSNINMERYRNLQTSRNQSILAHGLTPIKKKVYEEMKSFLFDLNLVPPNASYKFPELLIE